MQEHTPTYLQSASFTMETRHRSHNEGEATVAGYCTRHGRIALYPRSGDEIPAGVEYDLSIPRDVFESMGFPRVVTVTFQRGDRLQAVKA